MGQNNIISWSKDYLLNWSDFQAESNPAAFEDAHSIIKYRCTWIVNSDAVDNQIQFFIENIDLTAEFHSLLSWVRQPQATPQLLKHEQGHFDLAELLRSKIKKQIQSVFDEKKFPTRGQNPEQQKQFAREDSGLMIAKEVEKWEKYLFEKQEEYDKQTNYGQIIEKQQEYDDTFKKLRNVF
jgi:GTP cyclohydrolase II